MAGADQQFERRRLTAVWRAPSWQAPSLLLLLGVQAVMHEVAGLDNGKGRRPPMGYNTWNDFECRGEMSADGIVAVADSLLSSGLFAAG
jgi:hypothetical protein